MKKDLIEIERTYCNDVVQFFLNEFINNIVRPDWNSLSFCSELKSRLSRVIETRLLNTGLVINYNVDVMVFPLSEKRDRKINSVFTDDYCDVTDRVIVNLQYRNHHMVSIEHLIRY